MKLSILRVLNFWMKAKCARASLFCLRELCNLNQLLYMVVVLGRSNFWGVRKTLHFWTSVSLKYFFKKPGSRVQISEQNGMKYVLQSLWRWGNLKKHSLCAVEFLIWHFWLGVLSIICFFLFYELMLELISALTDKTYFGLLLQKYSMWVVHMYCGEI